MSKRFFINSLSFLFVVLFLAFFSKFAISCPCQVELDGVCYYKVEYGSVLPAGIPPEKRVFKASSWPMEPFRLGCDSYPCEVDGVIYYGSGYLMNSECYANAYYWGVKLTVYDKVIEEYQNKESLICPEQGKWYKKIGKSCDSQNCSIIVFSDEQGLCGDIVTTDCTSEQMSTCNSNNEWILTMYSCIEGNTVEELKEGLQDIYNRRCYESWSDVSSFLSNNATDAVVNYNGDMVAENIISSEYSDVDINGTSIKSEGGKTGNASIENATLSDLADYLSALQSNTAGVFKELAELNKNIKNINSGYDRTITKEINTVEGNLTIDWGSGEVEALSIEDFNTNLDIPNDLKNLDNSTYGSNVLNIIQSMPIISALKNSGVTVQDTQCEITGNVYGKEIKIDFCNSTITNLLNVMGNIIYAVAVFYFFFIVFTF